jgi:hypothetical protein
LLFVFVLSLTLNLHPPESWPSTKRWARNISFYIVLGSVSCRH